MFVSPLRLKSVACEQYTDKSPSKCLMSRDGCARDFRGVQPLQLGLLVVAGAVVERRQRKVVQRGQASKREELQPLVIAPADATEVLIVILCRCSCHTYAGCSTSPGYSKQQQERRAHSGSEL